jgi:peptide/nickel transport system ATP-binding protein
MIAPPCQVGSGRCVHLLCARSLTRRYASAQQGDGVAGGVERISLALNPGERLAIVGRSGAGKSTLARCLSLLDRLDAGELWVTGTNAWSTRNPAPLRRQVQLVLQDSEAAFNPRFSAMDAVEEPLRYGPSAPAALRMARARELLELVRLPRPAADVRARSLSGGQRRLVLLARGLATSPAVLILDETFTSLDGDLNASVSRMLFELQARMGFALILIGHDLKAVRECDRALIIDAGEVAESGPTADVFGNPRSAAGRSFVAAARRLAAAVPC